MDFKGANDDRRRVRGERGRRRGAVFCARHFEIGKSFPGMRKDDDGVYDLETESEETDEDSSCREGGTRVNAAVPRDGKRM